MATINWTHAGGGAFATGTNWSGGVTPSIFDDAVLGAEVNPYTVTASSGGDVNGIRIAASVTLYISGGDFVAIEGTHGGLNGGTIKVGDGAELETNGTIDNIGVISLAGAGAGATWIVGGELTGGGTVNMSDSLANSISVSAPGAGFENVNNTISGSGNIGIGGVTLQNDAFGVIDATGSAGLVLNTFGGPVTNAGHIEATGGGALVIEGTTIDGSSGGTILAGAASYVTLVNADIVGGALTGAGLIETSDRTSQLDGAASTVTNSGTVAIDDNASLTLQGAIANSGRIELFAGVDPTQLVVGAAGATLSGGGVVSLCDSAANALYAAAAGVTLTNVDNFIAGAGDIGQNGLILVNQAFGVIVGQGSNALVLDSVGYTITNAGLIEAEGSGSVLVEGALDNTATGAMAAVGGDLYLLAPITNSGLIESAGGHEVHVETAVDGSGGGVIQSTSGSTVALNGAILIGGTLATSGGTITCGGATLNGLTSTVHSTGQLGVDSGAALHIVGAIANSGTISLASAGAATDIRVLAGGATLSGGGTVILSGPVGRILGVSPATPLTNVDNTISGVGFVGVGMLTLTNEAAGVIDAAGAGSLVVGTKGEILTNAGLLEATKGALVLTGTTIDQSSGGTILAATGALVDLSDVDIVGGSVKAAGSGVMNVNVSGGVIDGTASAVTIVGQVQIVNGRYLTIQGAIDNTGAFHLFGSGAVTELIVGAAGVTLTGGGQMLMINHVDNRIVGAAASATLTNVDNHISGSGLLGGGTMTLINQASGSIAGNTNAGLTIDTGANTIVNAGAIDAVNAGVHVTVKSAVNNTGKLFAAGGTLVLDGAITGTGGGAINGGTLDVVTTSFTENVTFVGTTGVLELANSVGYTGTVKGLSLSGTSSLDLVDIGFTKGVTKASYVDNGSKTGGVLTVTDGTHTAHIKLSGNYSASTFVASGDGHGGTKVVDPATVVGQTHSMVAAMASFAPPAAAFAGGAAPIGICPVTPLTGPSQRL